MRHQLANLHQSTCYVLNKPPLYVQHSPEMQWNNLCAPFSLTYYQQWLAESGGFWISYSLEKSEPYYIHFENK